MSEVSQARIRIPRPAKPFRSTGYRIGLIIMGLFYVMAGVNHFVGTASYLAIMPPYIPWPLAMVYISGVAEILGGIGVLAPEWFRVPGTKFAIRKAAAWGIVALLIAVSPVHINMCLHPEAFPRIPLWVIWLRLPLQLPLIGWAWWYARD